ncbi:hypothetical protein PanWU01x14_099290, partial [Parasponia andersonii]
SFHFSPSLESNTNGSLQNDSLYLLAKILNFGSENVRNTILFDLGFSQKFEFWVCHVRICLHLKTMKTSIEFQEMNESMKKFLEIETTEKHLLLYQHQLVETGKIRNANQEPFTALRERVQTIKTSVPSPWSQ